VERALWTDERIDDVVDRVDQRFAAGDHRLERLERRFDRLEDQIDALRREMHNQFLVTTTAILSLAGFLAAHSLL
jgi:hypothetical protein